MRILLCFLLVFFPLSSFGGRRTTDQTPPPASGTSQRPVVVFPAIVWAPLDSTSVKGYKVYCFDVRLGFLWSVDVGDKLSYVETDAKPGKTYLFAVTSYDSFGIESDLSNFVAFTNAPSSNTIKSFQIFDDDNVFFVVDAPYGCKLRFWGSSDFVTWEFLGDYQNDNCVVIVRDVNAKTYLQRYYYFEVVG